MAVAVVAATSLAVAGAVTVAVAVEVLAQPCTVLARVQDPDYAN